MNWSLSRDTKRNQVSKMISVAQQERTKKTKGTIGCFGAAWWKSMIFSKRFDVPVATAAQDMWKFRICSIFVVFLPSGFVFLFLSSFLAALAPPDWVLPNSLLSTFNSVLIMFLLNWKVEILTAIRWLLPHLQPLLVIFLFVEIVNV